MLIFIIYYCDGLACKKLNLFTTIPPFRHLPERRIRGRGPAQRLARGQRRSATLRANGLDTHAIDARSHHGWPNSCGAVHQGEAGPQARSAANRFSLTDSRRECRRSTPRVPKAVARSRHIAGTAVGFVFQRNAPGRSVTAPAHRPRAVRGPVSAHASSPCPIRCGAGCPRRGIPWAPCSGRSGAGNAGPVPRAPGSRHARAR